MFDTSAQQDASRKVNLGRNLLQTSGIGDAIGVDGGNLKNVSLININQTIEEWSASAKPIFSITLIFVALRFGQDVRVPVAKLLQTTYPTTGSLGSLKGAFLKAPTGSDPSRNSFTTVEVGNWFRASRQIVKSLNFTFSQQVVKLDPSGTKTAPLFCIAQMEFSPFRMITYDEVLSYIQQNRGTLDKSFFDARDPRSVEAVAQEEGSGGIINAIKSGINIPGL